MRSQSFSQITSLCLFVLLSVSAFGQQNDSINRISRKYHKEVSVDMQGLFMRTPGATVIYKVKRNEGRIVHLNSQKNLRTQFSINGTIPLAERSTVRDTNTFLFSSKLKSTFNVSAMIGTENVIYYGKFNLYTGFDFGPYYSQSASGHTVVTHNLPNVSGTSSSWNGDSYWLQNDNKSVGLALVPFFGAKYRFSERFSACIETGLNLGFFMAKSQLSTTPYYYTKNPSTKVVADKEYMGFDLSMKYLRFLTLNYHF